MTTTPTLEQLQRGLSIAQQIDALEKELATILGTPSATVTKAAPAQADARKGKRSPATIAKMKVSQKARWSKVEAPAASKAPAKPAKKAPAPAKAPAPVKKKPTMSAEAKAKLSALMKARWEAKKAPKAEVEAPAAAEAPVPTETATE